MLAFHGVAFQYHRNKPFIQDLNLEFKPGRTLLLGPNGSGKSTIMNLAAGLLVPTLGNVSASNSIGLLSQKVQFFPNLNVNEQVAYVAWLARRDMKSSISGASDALAVVNLSHKRKERPKNLSGGELRRLGIAGLLNAKTDMMLLDEPTAGLDLAQSAIFYQTLRGLPKTTQIVVSTHQIEGLEDFFDFVIVVTNGKVVFNGSLKEFKALGKASKVKLSSNMLVNSYWHLTQNQIDAQSK
jgi:ABC-type multidrug transport system ATPase subunit